MIDRTAFKAVFIGTTFQYITKEFTSGCMHRDADVFAFAWLPRKDNAPGDEQQRYQTHPPKLRSSWKYVDINVYNEWDENSKYASKFFLKRNINMLSIPICKVFHNAPSDGINEGEGARNRCGNALRSNNGLCWSPWFFKTRFRQHTEHLLKKSNEEETISTVTSLDVT